MSLFSTYRQYLRENPQGYWFKRKIWGWGWTPARWQGWVVLTVFIAVFVLLLVPFLTLAVPNGAEMIAFVVKMALWAGVLIAIFYAKGEPPRWQWGLPPEEDGE